ncbi:hypothetical protein AWB81_01876 [Caballeronia arationis]|uniref:hypothetical protein n=1 Tax=Caballeronia arationis TaxID=1777142 RepID=UPI00074B70DE|nr:hypothetical protein [Caballeronia arationis]SAK59666.1 hypothetical protein AWB81_01876 [Caballeronia arationis]
MISDIKPITPPGPAFEEVPTPNKTPGWLESLFRQINKSILDVVHFAQHEYLDYRKLPHALKTSEVLTKPQLQQDRTIIVQTVFPIATENCFVVVYTPVFENGEDAMLGQQPDDVAVVDFKLFCYQERGRFVYENVPQTPTPPVAAELKRQAHALGLRNMQFLYFTVLTPNVVEAFDDPNGYSKPQAKVTEVSDGPTPAAD